MNLGKKSICVILPLLIASMFIASCATPPAPPPPEPEPVVVPEPKPEPKPEPPAAPTVSQDELDKLLTEAKELKKKAFDLKLFDVLPEEYKAAEASYAKALGHYDAKEGPAAKEGLISTIEMYKALIAKGTVDLAAARRKSAEEMRATALKAGADSKAADRFKPGDEELAAAKTLVEAGKHEEAIAAFEKARLVFELSYKRALASDLRARIAYRDYPKWDASNYQLGENKFAAEEGLWAAGTETDWRKGVEALDEAILRYGLVLQKGRESAAAESRTGSDSAKLRSESIKAQVAVKDLYNGALALYDEASAKLEAKEFEDAESLFNASEAAFEHAYGVAAEKRAAAETAMSAAEVATSESERKAEEGDSFLAEQPEVEQTSP